MSRPDFDGITFTEKNIDGYSADDLASYFRIRTQYVHDYRRPDDGEWVAWIENGGSTRSPFRDEAIVELVLQRGTQ